MLTVFVFVTVIQMVVVSFRRTVADSRLVHSLFTATHRWSEWTLINSLYKAKYTLRIKTTASLKKDKNTVNLHWIICQQVPRRGCCVVVVIGVQECVLRFCTHGVQDKEGSHNNGCSSLSVKGCKIVSVHVSIKCIPWTYSFPAYPLLCWQPVSSLYLLASISFMGEYSRSFNATFCGLAHIKLLWACKWIFIMVPFLS